MHPTKYIDDEYSWWHQNSHVRLWHGTSLNASLSIAKTGEISPPINYSDHVRQISHRLLGRAPNEQEWQTLIKRVIDPAQSEEFHVLPSGEMLRKRSPGTWFATYPERAMLYARDACLGGETGSKTCAALGLPKNYDESNAQAILLEVFVPYHLVEGWIVAHKPNRINRPDFVLRAEGSISADLIQEAYDIDWNPVWKEIRGLESTPRYG
jgi:hypothetical protein